MPLGRSLGIKSTKTKPPVSNKELEVTYAKNAKLNHKLVSNSSSLSNFPSRVNALTTTTTCFFSMSDSNKYRKFFASKNAV